ncbi:septum formation MAF [Babesia ovis]|uniref:Septum formation MAF n=1 Tax=Babesia ovis TaxID=5869 RepID=A0A9W5T8Y2_BABOV|nr:septum formation MAF [Babesia ovis]
MSITTALALGNRFRDPEGDYIVLASESLVRANILRQHLNIQNVLMMRSGFPEDLDKSTFPEVGEYVKATADGKARMVAEAIFGADNDEKRKALLSLLKNPFDSLPSTLDINNIKVVIGADTVCNCGGEIFEKPADENGARMQLAAYQSHNPEFVTGVSIYYRPIGFTKPACCFFDKTVVKFQRMTADDIQAYLNTQQYVGTSGSIRVTGFAESLVERMEGSYTNVVGLPAQKVSSHLCKIING